MSRGVQILSKSFVYYIDAFYPDFGKYLERVTETDWLRIDHVNDDVSIMEDCMSALAHRYNRYRKKHGFTPLMRNQLYVVYP